ncbi:DUF4350 domain-containing protein [Actinoplanes regularis]|uniref:DUF4350 domain-containing protein n=1 Tax=Actinoplanes regularis TaxID=52697 RepID=UPI0024A4E0EE|nr:DUF4350 domain-containing protein [Actinoplanes regularis]GLW31093.1 hypothetical protein Areg01_40330 [Actinoplanes regularis]
MTTTLSEPAPATTKSRPKRDRRWLRVAIPFAVLLTLVTGTLLVHAVERPDADDAEFLSPVSSAGIGGRQLADRLRGQGVTVTRETSTTDALASMNSGGPAATLFVTTPELADVERLSRFAALPAGTRVVVVAPTSVAINTTHWPIDQRGDRWTTAVTGPGCADPVATAAGPAAVARLRYTPVNTSSCYDGSLLTVAQDGVTITVVGAEDPFRNDRSGEHGNAALATGLLSQTSRVVWLDVHHRETLPTTSPTTTQPPTIPPQTLPTISESASESASPIEVTREPREQPQSQSEPNPLAEAFPSALWATLALLALALLALAVAAARRLGAPVTEPLPSRVPANETMLGHARLYQRARARDASLDVLRAAARRRITAHLGLPADATLADLAEHAGRDVDEVREILADAYPDKDAELVSAAEAVQNLVREITGFEGDQS